MGRTWHMAVAWLLGGMLAACGGGGGGSTSGGGGGGGETPEPTPTAIAGQLRWIGASGWADPAPAGQVVELVQLGADGSAGAVLASTTTGSGGAFELPWPAGRSTGDSFALRAAEADGVPVRALPFGGRVELGAASELLTRAYLDARQTAGGRIVEDAKRLQRWQTAGGQFLTLTPVRPRRGTEAALAELARWMARDPASTAALRALRQGRLPASLGDIGGLAGTGTGAWEVQGTVRGRYQQRVRASADQPGEIEFHLYPADADGGPGIPLPGSQSIPYAIAAFADDKVVEPRVYVAPGTGTQERVLRFMFGPLTYSAIGVATGRTEPLMQQVTTLTQPSASNPFPRGTRFEARSSITTEGIETLDALEGRPRALRTATREVLTITWPDGRVAQTDTRSNDWLVPFAGVVRTRSSITASGTGVTPTTTANDRDLLHGVTNAVSWPGRVLVEAQALALPANDHWWQPLGVTGDRALVLSTRSTDQVTPSALVLDLDTGARRAQRAFTTLPNSSGWVARLSPDGSKLYAVNSVLPPPSHTLPIRLAEADAVGARVDRFDAATLQREASLRLPAQRSPNVPGTGHPRYEVGSFMVSPADPTVFVAGSVGAVLVRGATPATQDLFDASAEYYNGALLGGAVWVWGWDGTTGELHAQVSGRSDPAHKIVPIVADGIPLAGARAGVGVLASDGLQYRGSRFTADRVYLGEANGVYDKRSGARLGGSDRAPCAPANGRVVCLGPLDDPRVSTLHLLDEATLAPAEVIDLQSNLRRAAGFAVPDRMDLLTHLGEGEFIAASELRPGWTERVLRIIR